MASLSVVFGTGPLGLAVIRGLVERGGRVRAVNRSGRAEVPEGVEVEAADVSLRDEAVRACRGATTLFHCASPPYHLWPRLHPPLMAGAISGASASGAKLIFGDNLYAYGPVDGPLTEELPARASGPNGRVRGRIAGDLMAAHARGIVRAAIGRGSDFFGPHARLSTVGDRVFARAIAGKPAQLLGDPDVPRSLTYIDDFARALITLAEAEEALGEAWHVPCPPPVPMRAFVELVFEEVGRPPRLRTAPRWGLALASLVSPTMRAVREQLYQHERPWIVDGSKFEKGFGWSATPLTEAVAATVAWFRTEA